MALDFEPLMPHEDDDYDEQPELIPPENPPAPAETIESPTKMIRGFIITDIKMLLPSTQTSSPSLRGNRGFDSNTMSISSSSEVMAVLPAEEISKDEPSTEIIVASGNNGDAIVPHEDADKESSHGKEESTALADQKDLWERRGGLMCMLASTEKYAGFMVKNHVLEMILANLKVSKSAIITEICLGILGNLACHEDLMESIVSTEGLIKAVVEQLFLDDVRCLCGAFRLLALGLQVKECIAWVKALLPARIIKRLVWIVENTLNEMFLEQGVGLFLTILQGQQGIPSVLIPSLIGQGLPEILISLLDEQTSKLYSDSIPERRRPVLDVILLAIEALSVMEDQSHRIFSNKELIRLICDLVKYPNKMEVNEARMTAAVLLANALADNSSLAVDISRDFHLLRGLLDVFPLTAKVKEAVWNVLSHILVHIKEHEMRASTLLSYVSVLLDKSDRIKDILLEPSTGPLSEHSSRTIVTALSRIISILKEWTGSNSDSKQSDADEEYNANDRAVRSLVECCERHLKVTTPVSLREDLAVTVVAAWFNGFGQTSAGHDRMSIAKS